jgi:hypothetical protein
VRRSDGLCVYARPLRASFIDPDKHGERAEQRFYSPIARFASLYCRIISRKGAKEAQKAQKVLKIQIFFKKS